MKTKILLLFFFSSLFVNTQAQTLVDTGKVWNVVECLNQGGCGTSTYYFQGNTSFNGHQFRILHFTSDWLWPVLQYPFAAREDSTKKVYFYSNATEFLVYDFALNKKDTFIGNWMGCGYQMTVDSVDSVYLLNGEPRKRLFLSHDTWIDGIGSIFGLTSMSLHYCVLDVYPELNCFTENGILKYKSTNFSSCAVNTVAVEKITSGNSLALYPNPLTTSSTLHFATQLNNAELIICDMLGKEMMRIPHVRDSGNEMKIEKGKMESGVYFVKVRAGEKELVEKLMVQ